MNFATRFLRRSAIAAILLMFGLSNPQVSPAKPAKNNSQSAVETLRGKATWYGPDFHGKLTASGKRFNQRKLVAAHPSWPFGTVAQVTNLDNGFSVKVNIIDRGPAKRFQRKVVVIDLSLAAARVLDFVDDGKIDVRIEVLEWGEGGSV